MELVTPQPLPVPAPPPTPSSALRIPLVISTQSHEVRTPNTTKIRNTKYETRQKCEHSTYHLAPTLPLPLLARLPRSPEIGLAPALLLLFSSGFEIEERVLNRASGWWWWCMTRRGFGGKGWFGGGHGGGDVRACVGVAGSEGGKGWKVGW